MFKMNPAAKEFVPAHLLKKRQEETDRLGELTEQLNKVDIGSNKAATENGESSKADKSSLENSKEVQESSVSKGSNEGNSESEPIDKKSTSTNHQQKNNHPIQNNNQHTENMNNNNNYNEADFPEALQDLIDEEDDRFLLNAGENLCEFNGEQFIIPCDDEYEPQVANPAGGYDFGNAEDNEDEDVCNAFEEFLDNLPAQ